jgi:hypothetical protein
VHECLVNVLAVELMTHPLGASADKIENTRLSCWPAAKQTPNYLVEEER